MRLIDADALTKFFKARMALWSSVDEVLDEISDAPTIEVEAIEPVKIEDVFGPHTWVCGYCHNLVGTKLFRNSYCSHCGRKVKWNAIEAEPIRRGKWNTKWFDYKERIVCSECELMADRMTDYCPNCGARMEVEGCD